MDDFIKPAKKQPYNYTPKLDQTLEVEQPEQTEEGPKQVIKEEPSVINLGVIDTSTEEKNQPMSHLSPSIKKHLSRKTKIIMIIVAIILLIIGSGLYWFIFKQDSKPVQTAKTVVKKEVLKAKPTSPLTGVELTDASLAKRPVTGLMIENSPDARPQSGMNEAGIIFEAVAEGGITRFLVLYQETQPQYIGPVRSIRPYYIDFALPFEAGLGHVGGSPDALRDIKTLGARDLDQFYNSGAYWRISERYAPHNVYTSFERLNALNQSKN